MSKELLDEANQIYGWKVVYEVKTVVELSDPDGAYAHFQDIGRDNHAECVEFLYFN
jgi:hypothetical protein